MVIDVKVDWHRLPAGDHDVISDGRRRAPMMGEMRDLLDFLYLRPVNK